MFACKVGYNISNILPVGVGSMTKIVFYFEILFHDKGIFHDIVIYICKPSYSQN